MNKETKKMIPEIRFPEFVNEEEWEKCSIDSVGNVVTGGTPSKEEKEYWGGDFVWITAQDFKEKYIFDSVLKLTLKGKDKSRVIPKNSVLVTCIASIGLNAINRVECATNQQINSIVCNSLNHYEFVYYAISKNITRLKNMAGQTAVPIISKSIFEKFTIQKPQKPFEQQKIASCLSSLDEVIAAHSQKLDALKEHKKGLKQNLFPQEGETVPKYRFKEFLNDGEWVEKKLDEVATFLKGKGISKADIVEKGSLPCIRYGELYTHYNETISIIKSYTNLSADDLVLSQANDVIIPASGETQIDIATASCVLEKGIALGGDLNIIRTKINGVFLSYYLNNVKKIDIAQMAQGISVVHLYPNQLKTLMINIPKPNEQQKIASSLSSLDALITAVAKKIEQLKLHKKGLMQGMFPKVNE
jgi:type I restriction enzyme S subunit